MASLISAPVATKSALSCPSFSSTACPKANPIKFPLCALNPHLGRQWIGLKHVCISISPKSLRSSGVPFSSRKRRCGVMVVRASLFGVGAPEALVIGVVALLVFGPKGLAEVARNLGKTLRAFQPTIRELQDVSREFKSTLEREIGLDDISGQGSSTYSSNRTETTSTPSSFRTSENPSTTMDPNGSPSPSTPYTSEEYLKITEEQLKASYAQEQAQLAPKGESQHDPSTQPQSEGTVKETASAAVPPQQKPENEV